MSSPHDFRENDSFQGFMEQTGQVNEANKELYCHNCCEVVSLRSNQFVCRYCHGFQLERVEDMSALERQHEPYT